MTPPYDEMRQAMQKSSTHLMRMRDQIAREWVPVMREAGRGFHIIGEAIEEAMISEAERARRRRIAQRRQAQCDQALALGLVVVWALALVVILAVYFL